MLSWSCLGLALALTPAGEAAGAPVAPDPGTLATPVTPGSPVSPVSDDPASEAASPDAAAAPAPDLLALQEMSLAELLDVKIVTASGTAERQTTAPANVTLITKDEIARFGWRSLGEMLANVPGLYVVDDGVQPSLSVRGVHGGLRAGTRIVKIMIDGVQVGFRPDLTAFLGPELIPVEVIERVEIVKGPLSALYGANAFLATVNVITRTAAPGLHAEVGSRGTWQQSSPGPGGGGSLVLAYGSEHFDLMLALSADVLDRSGLRVPHTFAAQDETPARFPFFAEATKSDLAQPLSGWMRAELRLAPLGKVTAQLGLQGLDSSGELQLNSVLTHGNRISLYNLWTHVDYEREWAAGTSTEVSLGWSQGGPRPEMRLVLPADERYAHVPRFDYGALDVAASVKLALGPVDLKLGGDYEHDDEQVLWYESVPFVPQAEPVGSDPEPRRVVLKSGGLYVSASVAPFTTVPGLRFVGNARVDQFTYGRQTRPWEVSWRLAATYGSDDGWAAKIFAGRSFQSPSAVLLFAQPGELGFGSTNNVVGQEVLRSRGFGKDPLRAQVVHSVEAVGSATLFTILSLQASAFFQQIDDTIRFLPFNNNFRAENGPTTRYVGGEVSAQVVVSRVIGKVAAAGIQPLATDAALDASGRVVPPAPAAELPVFPRFQLLANLGVALPEIHLHLDAVGRVIGERGASDANTIQNVSRPYTLGPYGDFDLIVSTLGWQPFGPDFEVIASFAVKNVIGDPHADAGFGGFDLPSPGRSFALSVRLVF